MNNSIQFCLKKSWFVFLFFGLFGFSQIALSQNDPVDYVNPFIGTSNGGNTFPGAVVPWGMASNSPHNDEKEAWSGARYFFGQENFFGFGQLHLSGVGCGDFGNILVTPTIGEINQKYSLYSKNEMASPGYYKSQLSNGISAELTATERSTLTKLTFPKSEKSNILFDVSSGLSPSKESYVKVVNNLEIVGYNRAGGFCLRKNEYTIFFVVQFNKAFSSSGTWNDMGISFVNKEEKGKKTGCFVSFKTKENEEILVKIGLSFVSIQNARENLNAEQSVWNFDRIKKTAKEKWNKELSKIKIEGGTKDQKTNFYTGLYHSLMHPNIINDVNGDYPAMKTKTIQKVEAGHNQYTVFSLWDTYRTLHPLLCLVYPERQMDMVRSMVDMAKHGGDLPFWELGADESYVMNGDPAAIVIVDSYFKGLKNFDTIFALKTMLNTAYLGEGNKIRPMNQYYMKHGFLPWDDCGPDDEWGKPRMVSECLEYAFADWNISQLANQLGYHKESKELLARSKAYNKYYDPATKFLRPKYLDGTWNEPFKPIGDLMVSMPGFVEGNSWQYTFFVPHDIEGLIKLMGGTDAFTTKLQECFDKNYFTVNNEPDIAYPFLFNYIKGEEWRSRKEIQKILARDYKNSHDGLPGNDDCGTISAWCVFASMGFYPDCPGKPIYSLSSPLFDQIEISLNQDFYKGKTFRIISDPSCKNKEDLLPSSLNGKKIKDFFINHADIVKGGELIFQNK